MGARSNIAWTGSTLNIGRGCRRKDAGCLNCYAETQAIRGSGPGGRYEGLVRMTPNGPRWTGAVSFDVDALDTGVRWQEPRFVFVDSMSDAFYDGFTSTQTAALVGSMMLAPHHVYQVLTKREDRAVEFFENVSPAGCIAAARVMGLRLSRRQAERAFAQLDPAHPLRPLFDLEIPSCDLPFNAAQLAHLRALRWADRILPHVWLGASCHDQESFNRRAPMVRRLTAAAVRFLSLEPLTGPITLGDSLRGRWRRNEGEQSSAAKPPGYGFTQELPIEWVIIGGESGRNARPCDIGWIRSLVQQLRAAGGTFGIGQPPQPVATFVKQLGAVATDDHTPGTPPSFSKNSASSAPPPAPLESSPAPGSRPRRLPLVGKADDPAAWPDDLLVQDFPVGVYLPGAAS